MYGPGIGRAVRQDAGARGRAGDVRAVAEAVERVGIRMRNRLVSRGVGLGVVAVADEVGAALDTRRGRAEPAPAAVGGGLAAPARLVRRDGARTAEVRVRVVDPRVDDGDLDAFAVKAEASPHLGAPISGMPWMFDSL